MRTTSKIITRTPKHSRFLRKPKADDVVIIKNHLITMDNESIKKALITSGIYDTNMKLTASFK